MPYAFPPDMARLGLLGAALELIPEATVREALEASSDVADGYLRAKYAPPLVWELLPSASRGDDGAGAAIDLGVADQTLKLALDVTKLAGVGVSLSASLETSEDGETGWTSAGSFDVVSASGHQVKSFKGLSRYVRVSWVLAGTSPSATFGVTFEGADLKSAVCKIAAYDLLVQQGFTPQGTDQSPRLRYQDAIDWLRRVSSGAVDPGFLDTTPDVDEGGAVFLSEAKRGW